MGWDQFAIGPSSRLGPVRDWDQFKSRSWIRRHLGVLVCYVDEREADLGEG